MKITEIEYSFLVKKAKGGRGVYTCSRGYGVLWLIDRPENQWAIMLVKKIRDYKSVGDYVSKKDYRLQIMSEYTEEHMKISSSPSDCLFVGGPIDGETRSSLGNTYHLIEPCASGDLITHTYHREIILIDNTLYSVMIHCD